MNTVSAVEGSPGRLPGRQPTSEPATSEKTSALLVTTLASFLNPFMSSSVNIALPTIGRTFGMDAVLLSWIATSFLLASAVFLVPCGRLADIVGRKRVFLYGTVVYTIGSLACGISGSATVLIGSRALQGIGGAMMFSTGMAILTSVFQAGERGRVLGINVAAVYLGLSLGPFLGGFLTQQFGWRMVFYVNVPLGLLIVGVVRWALKGEWAGAKGERFDVPGSLLYGVSLVALMVGVSRLPGVDGVGLIVGGVLFLGLFISWENRTPSPVIQLSLFRENLVFALSNLAALINYSATFAVTFLLSLYLQYVRGFEPQHAGTILVAQPIVMTVLSPIAGRLSDRWNPGAIASVGMALTAVGLLLLAFVGEESGMGYVLGSLVVLGCGFAFFSSPNTNAVMGAVDRKQYGIASAMLGTMRLTGQMLSMGIATLVFVLTIGRVEVGPRVAGLILPGVKVAFVVFSALCLAGVFASLARSGRRPAAEGREKKP